MDDEIFEALRWFFGEVGVETDGAGVVVATAPLGFHPLDVAAFRLHAKAWLPFRDQRQRGLLELQAIPFLDDVVALVLAGLAPVPISLCHTGG